MKVVYITYPWFLDFALEYIKVLSEKVDLHVIVVAQKNRTISTVFELDNNIKIETSKFYTLNDLGQSLKDAAFYKDYICNCKSFVFSFTPIKWRSFDTLHYNLKLKKYINHIDPDVIHFDDITIELFWQSLFLDSKRIILNVHDPIAHTGEKNRRRDFVRKLFYARVKKIIAFSTYSSKTFKENYSIESHTLSLVPYSFYAKYHQEKSLQSNYILFFGRISAYKGIEDLIKAYAEIRKEGDVENLIIAGKEVYGYKLPKDLLETEGVVYLNKFIENEELATLINGAKFIICPYKDATQSGVVMTAFAFGKKVITSKVGGLYEPINENNGLVYEKDDINGLKNAILKLLSEGTDSNSFEVSKENKTEYNVNKLIKIYEDNVRK
jgi:glycosyltransferase involved in cell wall biosynthesis